MRIVDLNGNPLVMDYCEEGMRLEPLYLDDGEYVRATSCVVATTHDVLFADPNGRVFLPVRDQYPLKDYNWFSGGRQMVGDSLETALIKNCRREVGLDVSNKTAVFLTMASFRCRFREQAPQGAGSHTFTHVYAIFLTDQEARQIRLNEEFGGDRMGTEMWFSPPRVAEGNFHPFVKRAVALLQATKI